jgi:hypothetical protein
VLTTTAAVWTQQIRDKLDAALSLQLDYDGTLEGDWTAAVGELAWQCGQGLQIGVDGLNPLTASGSALDAAVAPVVARKPAIASRYTCTVVTATTLPDGALYRDAQARSWRVVEGYGAVGVGDEVVLAAVDTGPVALSQGSPSTLTPITALVTPTNLTYTPGDTYAVGRDVESDSILRRRWALSLGRPNCPTFAGIRRTVLGLLWVEQVAIARTAPGVLGIAVYPAPVGATQEDELGRAIYGCIGAQAQTVGAESVSITGVDGRAVVVRWTNPTTEAVDVDITVQLLTGTTLADVTSAVEQATLGVFGALSVGDTLYRLALAQALPGPASGIVGGVILLDGVAADVTPALVTTLLVPGTITVHT